MRVSFYCPVYFLYLRRASVSEYILFELIVNAHPRLDERCQGITHKSLNAVSMLRKVKNSPAFNIYFAAQRF